MGVGESSLSESVDLLSKSLKDIEKKIGNYSLFLSTFNTY